MRPPSAWSTVVAISAMGIVEIELRVAEKPKHRKIEGGRKRKQTSDTRRTKDIDELITSRGYRSIHLPPYSPELNPMEQFWSVVKSKFKRGTISDNEDLKTRIAEACNNVPVHHLKAFIQHSCNQFDKCKKQKAHL
ncbi:hypothetical protein G6F56_000907 [Rhizopus delemar]|nr:hypothetical protein G6F56_000907 [Rhizopus delemar]